MLGVNRPVSSHRTEFLNPQDFTSQGGDNATLEVRVSKPNEIVKIQDVQEPVAINIQSLVPKRKMQKDLKQATKS